MQMPILPLRVAPWMASGWYLDFRCHHFLSEYTWPPGQKHQAENEKQEQDEDCNLHTMNCAVPQPISEATYPWALKVPTVGTKSLQWALYVPTSGHNNHTQ